MTGRPPKGRTWGRRGITPRVKVSGRKGERRSLGEADCIRLLDGAHQLLKAPLIVVWDRLSTHTSKTMKALVAERD
ncbi:hypothetical protein ACFU8W_44890 [Streptomyces sp. NPDC057565]|uniref:hypothetical protein n=1 Tax=Streptomyces sp. NPDC057565 TaxID=3346169 RepID=UPI0036950048